MLKIIGIWLKAEFHRLSAESYQGMKKWLEMFIIESVHNREIMFGSVHVFVCLEIWNTVQGTTSKFDRNSPSLQCKGGRGPAYFVL